MTTDLVNAHALLTTLDQPHRGGHHCPDTDSPTARGTWVPFREECGPRAAIRDLRAILDRIGEQVHAAAHDPASVDVVASAMLAGTPLAELSPEVAEGWRQMAHLAIEGLAAHLNRGARIVHPIRYGIRDGQEYAETCSPEEAHAWAVYRLDAEGMEQWVSDHPTRDGALAAAQQ